MKNFKRTLTVVLAVAVMFALSSIAAFADTTYSVTINKDTTDKAAHTYGAYQLFKGDLATDNGKTILSNVTWGDNVNSATVIEELNKLDGFSLDSDATAAVVAKAISDKNYTTDSAGAKALAEALNKAITGDPKGTASVAANATSGTITGLAPGYYLVKDTATVGVNGASTKYILEVVKNVTVTEKASVPSVDKEIAESTPTKVSDYSIGDDIPYTITGTLPSTFANFETYKTFTFTDTLSAGLTPPAASDVTVKVGNDNITDLFDVSVSGQKLTVSLKEGVDLKTAKHGGGEGTAFAAGDAIVVSYSAKLNEDAVCGGTGNVNTAQLQFSNNPNSQGEGDDDTGTTPGDKTVVFTYDIKALKVKPTDDAPIDQDAYDAFTAEEKADYVKVGDKYQKTTSLEGAGFTLYKGSKSEENKVAEITKGSTFEFKGVDAGTYILSETTVPSGYNAIDDITIVVTATYDTTKTPPEIKTLTCTPDIFTATKSTGTIEGKILNESGSTLPSTGGMGTKILYAIGIILVLAAAITLIVRRRMQSE